MCGIVGVAGRHGRSEVSRLVTGLAHRGPDDEGVWSDSALTMGHRRLAIIGLDADGAQPRVSRSTESVIVFNGEIYNYLELADELEKLGRKPDRRFDTDVLIESLEEWGPSALERFNGMFALAWYRPREGRVLLARDRFGQKPLFWGRPVLEGKRSLVFGSELRVFRDLRGGPPPPSPLGVARYLAYDGMPAEQTVYKGVEKVPAGSFVDAEIAGAETRRRYFTYRRRPSSLSLDQAIAALDQGIERSLERRLRSDVPVGLFLSGGIDSSLLATTWRQLRPGDVIQTFTVGFEDASYDESRQARELATHIGAEHHELRVQESDFVNEIDRVWEHLSEPLADPSIIPTSLLCRYASQHVSVALGGDGGDELAAGYDPFKAWGPARIADRFPGASRTAWLVERIQRHLPVEDRNMSLRFKLHHFAQGLRVPPSERISAWMAGFSPAAALAVMNSDLARDVDVDEIFEPTRRAYRRAEAAGEISAQISVWLDTYLEACILTKVDRASMMSSLEVRAPLLDPELADVFAQLPDHLLYRRGRGKVALRELAAQKMPAEVSRRPKKGFGVPTSRWLRTHLRPRFEACLRDARDGGWFDATAIESLWRAHLERRVEARRALWAFLFSYPFQRAVR